MKLHGYLSIALLTTLTAVLGQASEISTNDAFTTSTIGWSLGNGCSTSQDSTDGAVTMNACGVASSDPFAVQAASGLSVDASNTISMNSSMVLVDAGVHVSTDPLPSVDVSASSGAEITVPTDNAQFFVGTPGAAAAAVPEPAALLLIGSGLTALAVYRRRR